MHTHTIDLLERLLGASEDGRITWAEVPGKTAYSYLAGEYVVLIDADCEGAAFRLSDTKGRALEEAGIDDLAAVNLGSGASALSVVQRMHEIAKRQTMGTDAAIASVITHLQDLEGDEVQNDGPQVEAEGAEVPPVGDTQPVSEDVERAHEDDAAPESEAIPEDEAVMMLQSEATQDALPETDIPMEEMEPEHGHEDVASASVKTEKKRKKRSLFNPFGRKKS
jgi:hypothetical protein